MGSIKEIQVPDIGDFSDVEVIEVAISPGDRVELESPLITLESEKAAMDIPSPYAGVIREVRASVGDRISEGMIIATVETVDAGEEEAIGETAPVAPEPPASPPAREPAAVPPAPETTVQETPSPASGSPAPADIPASRPHASPSVRCFARELGVDLALVKPSGPKGRILRQDVQNYVKAGLSQSDVAPASAGAGLSVAAMPAIDFSRFGPVKRQVLSRIKQIAGANLQRNWVTLPHVTQFGEADITELEAFRISERPAAEARGVRLTLVSFLMKAVVVALKAFPEFNSSLDPDGEHLLLKGYFNIGIAVDTPEGLVVPVFREVDQKSLLDLAEELGSVSTRARAGKLSLADLQGGCFTISSLGGIGGTAFTPIINAPEVAILGVSRAVQKPVYQERGFVPRLMLPLSLSYDHRVIDGAAGARFITHLGELLGDARKLLL